MRPDDKNIIAGVLHRKAKIDRADRAGLTDKICQPLKIIRR